MDIKAEDDPLCFVRTFVAGPINLAEVTINFSAEPLIICLVRYTLTGHVFAGSHTSASLLLLNPTLADPKKLVSMFASMPKVIEMPQGLVLHYETEAGSLVLVLISRRCDKTQTLLLTP